MEITLEIKRDLKDVLSGRMKLVSRDTHLSAKKEKASQGSDSYKMP